MSHRRVRDVMTTGVVTVPSDMRFKELAALLDRLKVSALPVLGSGGQVAGVVSELDLLRKEEYQEDPDAKRPPRWRRWANRARARGRTAADVMSTPDGVVDVAGQLRFVVDDTHPVHVDMSRY